MMLYYIRWAYFKAGAIIESMYQVPDAQTLLLLLALSVLKSYILALIIFLQSPDMS